MRRTNTICREKVFKTVWLRALDADQRLGGECRRVPQRYCLGYSETLGVRRTTQGSSHVVGTRQTRNLTLGRAVQSFGNATGLMPASGGNAKVSVAAAFFGKRPGGVIRHRRRRLMMDGVQLKEYQRLRMSGVWQDANALRERLRRTLRAQGWSRRQSRELSWRLMLNEYPAATGGVPSDESSAISAANRQT